MEIDQGSSPLSIVYQLDRTTFARNPSKLKSRELTSSTNKPIRMSQVYKGTGRYSTDDEMHICVTEDEMEAEKGDMVAPSIPSSTSFFHSLRKRYSTCLSTQNGFVSAKIPSQRNLMQLARSPSLAQVVAPIKSTRDSLDSQSSTMRIDQPPKKSPSILQRLSLLPA